MTSNNNTINMEKEKSPRLYPHEENEYRNKRGLPYVERVDSFALHGFLNETTPSQRERKEREIDGAMRMKEP